MELKYRLASLAAGRAVLALDRLAGLVASGPAEHLAVEDRYVDTADGALARAGFAARLRTIGATTVLSLKSSVRRGSTAAGEPHRREEVDGPADAATGPRDWPDSAARSIVLEAIGDAPLAEVVTLRQRRRRRLFGDDATTVELSLDQVEAVARDRVVDRWLELEVELVRGDEARLRDVARDLEARPGLTPVQASKLGSALEAVRRAPQAGRQPRVSGG